MESLVPFFHIGLRVKILFQGVLKDHSEAITWMDYFHSFIMYLNHPWGGLHSLTVKNSMPHQMWEMWDPQSESRKFDHWVNNLHLQPESVQGESELVQSLALRNYDSCLQRKVCCHSHPALEFESETNKRLWWSNTHTLMCMKRQV